MKRNPYSPALRRAAYRGCPVAYKIVYQGADATVGDFEKCACPVCIKL